jgi:NADPH-dependent F420 reductase
MRIGIIGGTGKEGSGLAIRWARAGHEVRIGSRDGERGAARAAELNTEYSVTLEGGSNEWAIEGADVSVLSVPYSAHRPTLEGLRDALQSHILVDITVPLRPPKVTRVHLPEGHAAALEAQALLGEGVRVVASLHHVSSVHLADADHAIDCDVLTCGDDNDAVELVCGLIGDLGMRGVHAGALANAVALESLTPVLIHLNKKYKSAGTGLRITGI